MARVYIGTAGWSIPRESSPRTPAPGTHLERYARVFAGVEVNSSFYRPHQARTYRRWAASTADDFRFAVKMPRAITHELRLVGTRALLRQFLAESDGLGDRRGPVLVQLPPSLAFDRRVAARFFDTLRTLHAGPVVCEPRHPTWFASGVEALLAHHAVARVAADPAVTPTAAAPGGWPGLAYFRLHGSPRMYWSPYRAADLARLAASIRRLAGSVDVWCVFDNTASGAAFENAWELQEVLRGATAPGRKSRR